MYICIYKYCIYIHCSFLMCLHSHHLCVIYIPVSSTCHLYLTVLEVSAFWATFLEVGVFAKFWAIFRFNWIQGAHTRFQQFEAILAFLFIPAAEPCPCGAPTTLHSAPTALDVPSILENGSDLDFGKSISDLKWF